ncbi:TonB family protein [Thalassobaculum sp. OXR-137]|uniref:TonB family protein n=1 Tax=Thalassobaculum sp. OXR-137 TaxID=3100173 RepID=UPI002AC98334|nr:TonB family protein [Thalassobaculum sp. OXR-137]WPZ34297.1 TonB family protein [Thalassobaculum sp. OXR-137]
MPAAADRILGPAPPQPAGRPLLVALAVAASVAVHGVALAAAIGWWGGPQTTAPEPFEVVMVTLTQPNRTAAPGSAIAGGPAPQPADRAGPPAVTMPVAEAAAPAVAAPLPFSAPAATDSPARPVPAPLPAKAMPAAPAPAPVQVAEVRPEAAAVERVETPEPVPARIAEPPRPVARPASPSAAPPAAPPAAVASREGAAKPAAASTETASPARGAGPASTPTSVAALSGLRDDEAGGSSPAEFSVGSAGNPAPDYPFRARQRGWEGRVVLRVAVDRSGHPVRIAVAESSGHGVLDTAAHQTVATWVFRPARRGGQPVAGETLVPVVFRLN